MPILTRQREILLVSILFGWAISLSAYGQDGYAVRGQVVLTTTGEPVQGVRVMAAGREAVTGSDGRYEAVGVPEGQWAVYLDEVPEGMYAEVYDDLMIDAQFGPPSIYALADDLITVDSADVDGIDFQIGFGGMVTGVVTDSASNPVPEASVKLWRLSPHREIAQFSYYSATTGENGEYLFNAIKPGNYYLSAFKGGGEWAGAAFGLGPCQHCDSRGDLVPVREGESTDIDIELVSRGSISGRIEFPDGDSPPGNFFVNVLTEERNWAAGLQLIGTGEYRFEGLSPGKYYVHADARSVFVSELYPDAPCVYECLFEQAELVEVQASTETSGVNIAVELGGSLSITADESVVGSGAIYTKTGDFLGWFGYSITGESPFSVPQRDVPVGEIFVYLEPRDHVPMWNGGIPCPGRVCSVPSGKPVTIKADDFAPVTVPLDSGVVGPLVRLFNRTTGYQVVQAKVQLLDVTGAVAARATTSTWRYGLVVSGTSFARIYPGTYYIGVPATDGYRPAIVGAGDCPASGCDVSQGTPFEVQGGEPPMVDLEVIGASKISGFVFDETKSALQGATVTAYDVQSRFVGSSVSSEDGSYAIRNLPPGPTFLRADIAGHLPLIYEGYACSNAFCDVVSGTSVDAPINGSVRDLNLCYGQCPDSVEAPAINAGYSGSWFDPDHDGEGWLLEILSVESVSKSGGKTPGTAVAYWFTYPPGKGSAPEQTWIVGVGSIVGNTITFDNAQVTEGAQFGETFDPGTVNRETWGDFEFVFDGCDSGTVTYSGPAEYGSGTMQLSRITQIAGASCAQPTKTTILESSISGSWFDPNHDGEGWLIEVLSEDTALIYWFSYDGDGNQAWWVGVGSIAGKTITVEEAFRPVGAVFGEAFEPSDVTQVPWGSLEFVFDGCDSGSMTYQSGLAEFGSGSLALQRITGVAGLACSGQ